MRVTDRRSESAADEPSTSYPIDQLFEEVAFVAYHFNWSHDEVLAMPHWERRRWCEEISKINDAVNEGHR